jgi:hypothetical protein
MEIAPDDEKQLSPEKMYYKYIFLSKNPPVHRFFQHHTITLNQ